MTNDRLRSNVIRLLNSMLDLCFNQNLFHDVTFICKTGLFHCNKVLLAIVFPSMHQVFQFQDSDHAMISIPDVDAKDFVKFFKSLAGKESLVSTTISYDFLRLPPNIKVEESNATQTLDMEIKTEDPLAIEDRSLEDFADNNETAMEENDDNDVKEEVIHKISVVKMTDEMFGMRRPRRDKGKKRERKGEYTKFDYVENKNSKEPTSKKECFLCGEVIVGLKNFEVHKRDKHRMSANSKRLECPTCKKMFSVKIIKSHINSKHSGIKKMPCKICRKWFTEDDLKEHSKSCLKEPKEKLVCSICGKSVNSSHLLRAHTLQQHSGIEETCTICGKVFNTKGNLNKHMGTHQEKKPCPECGLMIRQMKLHMETVHTPDHLKRYQCNECGKGFHEKANLTKHNMNAHLKTRPYQCRYGCDMRYNDVSNRDSHEKKKHGQLYTTVNRENP